MTSNRGFQRRWWGCEMCGRVGFVLLIWGQWRCERGCRRGF